MFAIAGSPAAVHAAGSAGAETALCQFPLLYGVVVLVLSVFWCSAMRLLSVRRPTTRSFPYATVVPGALA